MRDAYCEVCSVEHHVTLVKIVVLVIHYAGLFVHPLLRIKDQERFKWVRIDRIDVFMIRICTCRAMWLWDHWLRMTSSYHWGNWSTSMIGIHQMLRKVEVFESNFLKKVLDFSCYKEPLGLVKSEQGREHGRMHAEERPSYLKETPQLILMWYFLACVFIVEFLSYSKLWLLKSQLITRNDRYSNSSCTSTNWIETVQEIAENKSVITCLI